MMLHKIHLSSISMGQHKRPKQCYLSVIHIKHISNENITTTVRLYIITAIKKWKLQTSFLERRHMSTLNP